MPDEDPGDVFLRHRGAVLDALLSDPTFGTIGGGVTEEPSVSEPVMSSASTGPVVSASPAPSVTPRPRRASDGPSASERINALLNGRTPDTSPPSNVASDYAEMAGSRLGAPSEPLQPDQPAVDSATRSMQTAGAGTSSLRDTTREIVTQLRNPKVALALVGVAALLLVIALVFTGGNDKAESDRIAVVVPSAAPTATQPPVSGTAGVTGRIQVRAADSKCPPGGTPGMDAFSGETGKAWSCTRAYKLDGQVLTIDLGKKYKIDSIGIVPGWDHIGPEGEDQWSKHRTVSRVSYQFNDTNTTVYTQQTLDQRTLVTTKVEPPVSASKIFLTVLKSNGDSSINITAISSIVITGQ